MEGRLKKVIIILSVVAVACILWTVAVIDVIPPRSMTAGRMLRLKRKVLQYAQSHGELPKSLTTLPPMDGYDNSIQDGWKRDIIFEVSESGVVSFRSLGRDGFSGGSGEDADIVRSFPAHDASGKWSDEMVEWSVDTFKRSRRFQ